MKNYVRVGKVWRFVVHHADIVDGCVDMWKASNCVGNKVE
jgi:hypothetical protein